MAVKVYDIQTLSGSISLVVGSEVTVIEITGDGTHWFMVEGWLDLSALASGDAITVTEYVCVDGTNYGVFNTGDFADAQDEPILHFHMKLFAPDQKYKVAITQTAGTARTLPYRFVVEYIEKTV